MCKVKYYTTDVYYKALIGDNEEYGDVQKYTLKGRYRAENRRAKLIRDHIVTDDGVRDSDIVAVKIVGYKIIEHTYHINWTIIQEYGREINTSIVFEG